MRWAEQFANDLRYAIRGLGRSPGFTLVAILTLAVGIGVNTAIFSLLSTALLRPLPVANSARLMVLSRGHDDPFISYLDFVDFQSRSRSFDGFAVSTITESTLDADGHASSIGTEPVSGGYAKVVGVGTALGRWFTNDDEPVAVIGYDAWQHTFAGDRAVLGKTIRSEGLRYTIIGVAQRGFTGLFGITSTDLWVPIRTWASQYPSFSRDLDDRTRARWMAVAPLKTGANPKQAAVELNLISQQVHAQDPPQSRKLDPIVVERATGLVNPRATRQVVPILALLIVVVGFVLLIACANVGNLMLARGIAREREIFTRLALGASRGRLLRQLVTESLLLALLGGVAGVIFGVICIRLVEARFISLGVLEHTSFAITLDFRAVFLTAVVSMASVLIFGLLPARQTVRISASRRPRVRFRVIALVAQVALSVVLLFCSASLLRTISRLSQIDPGFPVANRIYAETYASPADFTAEQGRAFYSRALEQVAALPGVRSVGLTNLLPFVTVPRGCAAADQDASTPVRTSSQIIDPGYLPAMGIPMLAGRSFDAGDTPGKPRVAIVNEELARELWPGGSSLGHRIFLGCGDHSAAEVIGVARNTNVRTLGEPPQPHFYVPFSQNYTARSIIVMEVSSGFPTLLPSVQRIILAASPGASLYRVQTLGEYIQNSYWQLRLQSSLLSAFGILGLVLAAVGLYGSVAYRVTLRRKGLAIRAALGARASVVFGLVVREALIWTILGVVIGTALSLPLGGVLARLWPGVRALDPAAPLGTAAIWIITALAGAALPAWRAVKLEPMIVLRLD